MRARLMLLLVIAAGLAGCNQVAATNDLEPALKSPGRYAGIGTFEAGRLWHHLARATASKDPKAATLADDEHIIVVLDSHTGEVRQCGDHSGVCVAMSPWGAAPPVTVPTPLVRHAADLDAEAKRDAEAETPTRR
jgi:hypothetical protein